jgi:hypothetical protein
MAVQLIKEMSETCGVDLEQSSLIFSCRNLDGNESKDCQLEILKANLNDGTRTCLYALMDERKWKFKEETDRIVILDTDHVYYRSNNSVKM